MNKNKLQKGTQVQILDNSNWHGLFAIVDDIVDIDNNNINIPVLYCVSKPTEKYYVYSELEDMIRVVGDELCCPNCGKQRYWIKYFVNKKIMFCQDCQYHEDIK